MPEQVNGTQIVDIFKPQLGSDKQGFAVFDIVHKWEYEMHAVVNGIFSQGNFNPKLADQYHQGITKWVQHPDHGAQHSVYVYLGARYMMDETGEWKGDSFQDSQLQIEAATHDLFQTVPFLNLLTGETSAIDPRISHPQLSARVILATGAILKIDPHLTRTAAVDVRHHDDTYFGRTFNNFSPIGKYVADADKLFGANSNQRDPKALVRAAIDRNRRGVLNSMGEVNMDSWYFLRDDLTHPWQYGDRWYADRLSALQTDMMGSRFYTKIGQRIGEERRRAFIEIAGEEFAKEYDAMRRIIEEWKKTADSGNNSIELVGKNQQPIPMDRYNLAEVISFAYESQLPFPIKPDRSPPKGYLVALHSPSGAHIIDPSIARFKTKEDFLDAISKRLN